MQITSCLLRSWLLGMMLAMALTVSPVQADVEHPAEPAPAPAGPSWVYLDVHRALGKPLYSTGGGLLGRELLRQSILLAAREELQVRTVDAVLDEPLPRDRASGLVIMPMVSASTRNARIRLHLGDEKKHWSQVVHKFTEGTPPLAQEYLLEVVEGWSRQELPAALREKGLQGQANVWHDQGEPAEGTQVLHYPIEYTLSDCLRLLHRDIRANGESPQRLGAMVRGYALLGQVTRYHWTASEQVFHARALLYAQWLMHRTGGSRWARWHRAYAWAMVGRSMSAIEDLQAAAAMEGDEPAPQWVKWIEAMANDRPGDLVAGEEVEPKEPLVMHFIRYLLAERYVDVDIVAPAGQDFLKQFPYSMRVIQSVAQSGGVGNQHMTSALTEEVMKVWPQILSRGIPDLPEAARPLIERMSEQEWPRTELPALVKVLEAAGDVSVCADEMGWAVLGRLLIEAQFAGVYNIAHFQNHHWGVDAVPFLKQGLIGVGEHRYRAVLEAMKLDPARQSAAVDQLMASIDYGDPKMGMRRLFDHDWWGQSPEGKELRTQVWNSLYYGTEATTQNQAYWLITRGGSGKEYDDYHLGLLMKVAPHSPITFAQRIKLTPEAVAGELQEIQKRFADDSYVLRTLALHYLAQKDIVRAKGVLADHNRVLLNRWGSEKLANLYLDEGDEDAWLATLQLYLDKGIDAGLDKSWVNGRISRHFMDSQRYERALPFALQAAESYSALGLNMAALCLENLGRWKESEEYERAKSERYEDYASAVMDWYLWCQRTGRGNLAMARKLAGRFAARPSDNATDPDIPYYNAIYHYMEGNLQRAAWHFSQFSDLQRRRTPIALVHQIIIAHRTQDEALMQKMTAYFTGEEKLVFEKPEHILAGQLVERFLPALDKGPEHLDLPAIEAWWAQSNADENASHTMSYYAAEFLSLLDRPEDASRYFKKCIRPYDTFKWDVSTLAYWSMRKKGIDPYQKVPQ